MLNLDKLLSPKSVAVIGASNTPSKVGGIVINNLLNSNYPGNIYPINPKEEKISWLKCYPDLDSLPEVPELAIIAIPAAITIDILKQVGEKGIKDVVVFTAGFKEMGEEGMELEKQLIATAQKYQLNILGPNCLGYVNNTLPINVTFGQVVNQPGNLRFISQSGAIASSIFDWAQANGLGFSDFVTLGNKSVINENHILEYWREKNHLAVFDTSMSTVHPIGLYLESISDGQQFLHILKQTTSKNPVFVLKPGKSEAAAKAMQSHTGSIAGADAVLEAALKQAGAIRCEGIQDFFDYARAFAWENAPQGPRVTVISNAGGPAVMSADAIAESGLELAQLDPKSHDQLLKVLPRAASIHNPIDVLGDALASRYGDAIDIVLQQDQVDAIIVILTPQVMTQIEETARIIGEMSLKYQKPILCSFMGGSHIAKGEDILNQYRIPSFRFPERAIRTLGVMWQWRQNQHQQSADQGKYPAVINDESITTILKTAQSQSQTSLDNFATNDIFAKVGITTPDTSRVDSLDQAKITASQFGYPVVLKLISHKLLHKTESKGVLKNLQTPKQLQKAYQIMNDNLNSLEPEIKASTVIQIQKQIENGVEVILGVKTDPTFGSVLMFGAGGTLTELILDRNLKILPVTHGQAVHLVEQSKIYKVLKGYRGDQPYNIDQLADLLVKLSQLALSFPQIKEIEINPVIITHDNAWAVDGKVVLS